MQALLSKLPAFALPFVTRSLRGGRGRRYLIFSLVLTALTGIMGMWIALGSGNFEQGMRTEFGLEEHEWEREHDEFTVFVHDEFELRDAEREIARLHNSPNPYVDDVYGYSGAFALADWGRALMEEAAWSSGYTNEHRQLQREARVVLGVGQEYNEMWGARFPWHDTRQVEQLRNVLAHGGVPSVEMYRSPLGFNDALRIAGFIAGIILAGLATVFAPLLVAVQQAQERHENTLMPLTGTALSPRELALGLASGPAAVVGIFAAPQLAVFLVCAAFAGELLVAGALLAALAATSGLFIFGGQLLGQLMGHRRTPGIIGIALMALAGVAWLSGGAIAAEGDHEAAGFAAVLPHIGLSALLAEVFIELPARFSRVFVGTFVWTGGAVMLGWLTMTALARKIEGRNGALLSRGQAGLGALICIILVNVALPNTTYDNESLHQYLGLAMLAMPLALLLMARVPAGDGPPRMRRVPVPALLLEFLAWAAAHVVLAGVVFGFDAQALHPVALMWLVWCTAVLGLIAVRMVSVPGKIATNVWTAFCALSLPLGFAQAIFWGVEGGTRELQDMFVMFELSPVLGLLQLGLTVWIPWSMVRHLNKNLGDIT